LGVEALDKEGRIVVADYQGFRLYNVYFPNGKQSDERLRYKLEFYDAFLDHLDSLKEGNTRVVVCGDYNTAHHEIDLARPRENEKISGFLPVERQWMDRLVAHGYLDTFRHFHKDPDHYTWWDVKSRARERNVGWRIDYFFVSEDLLPAVSEAFIMPDVMGSDHCPVGIVLNVP
jgi:exodeoxyribonuclease-3